MTFRNLFLSAVCGCVMAAPLAAQDAATDPALEEGVDYFAVIETNKGQIVLDLYEDVAPVTVQNFVNLAEGNKEYTDPNTREASTEPYYDGVIFHRVIPGFMIQAGDPTGTGRGGPGFTIADEFNSAYSFSNEDYILAMANIGRPNTGGAQFFITTGGSFPRHLNNRHTIFGRAVEGQEVVDAIAGVRRDPRDKPLEDVVMEEVSILRVTGEQTWKDALEGGAAEEAEAPATQPAETQPATTQPETTRAVPPAPQDITPSEP